MLSSRENTFLSAIYCLTILLEHNYLFTHVEAVNGVIWSKTSNDFVRIFSIESFAKMEQERVSITRSIETHNFNGTQLRLTAYVVNNLINFTSNDTVITGLYGDMWHLISEILNFKIHIKKLSHNNIGSKKPNGSWDGLLGYIYRNETDIVPACLPTPDRKLDFDFTLGTLKSGHGIYMKEQLRNQKTWMTKLFSRKLWFGIIGIFSALTLASYLLHVLNLTGEKTGDSISSIQDHCIYMFSIFCDQGWKSDQLENRSKILMITTVLCSWLLIIAFGSTLTSHIAHRKFQPPFTDLQSFYKNTDYVLIVGKNSLIYSIFRTSTDPIYKTIFNSGRLIQADNAEAFEKICQGKYIYLQSQAVIEAENDQYCALSVIGEPYFSTYISAGLTRGFKYKKTLNMGILKLFETGIYHRLKSKWTKKKVPIKISGTFEAVELEQVCVIFVMLACAMVLSFVILFIENIFHCGRMQNRRKKYSA